MSSEEGINHETGLFTRSMIEILLSHEITRSLRYPSPLTILRLIFLTPTCALRMLPDITTAAISSSLPPRPPTAG
ncbi:MAG: hypothetical protein HZC38_12555 [Chloroflexi bacterium]|nr:hypothetical protein [Chloroflexota bacterium]